ncbi:siderophore-interacting protein [Nocardia fusca]|uniref:siderophore-interacting protein n=1 Tax=Nocardia fusca TaxID=941183 RepID=UPI0007A758F5|nr:siderophore-interacting protein [Nocardia fusca]
MATRTKYVKPEQRRICTAETLAAERIGHSFIRVTVGGPDLADFVPMGYDQWIRLFLPRERQTGLRLPTAAQNTLWYTQCLAMSSDTRPLIRNYTVRGFRPAGAGFFGEHAEIDVDFVAHGDSGPASAWAAQVRPGIPIGLLDEGIMYQAPPHASWSLLVGDESALPAIAGVLRSAPRDLCGAAYIEVPHRTDIQDLGEPTGVRVHWLPRADPRVRIGRPATEAVRAAALPDGPGYAFVAGEQQLVAGVRRHLVRDRGVPRSDIMFSGFWRLGQAASN